MLDILRNHTPDAGEEQHLRDICDLIETHGDRAFYRDHFTPGHMTGSGLLISADGSRVLMNHHKFLNIWICFGGHADGEKDILNVALREVIEESGIEDVEPVATSIFSVDVHGIPHNSKKNEPAHKHFDIRYLFRVRNASNENFAESDESQSLRWCNYQEAKLLAAPHDLSMHRLLDKWAGV
jgi:8-oxo-dGTP pyrophosphatase MutT (NUDIX family)